MTRPAAPGDLCFVDVPSAHDSAAWIDAFVMEINKRGSTATPATLVELAEAYVFSHAASDPVKVARWVIEVQGLPVDRADRSAGH